MKMFLVLMSLVFGLVASSPTFAFKDWVGTKPPNKQSGKQYTPKMQKPVTMGKYQKAPKTRDYPPYKGGYPLSNK